MSDPADAGLAAADLERIAGVIELSEGFILQPIVVPNHDVAGAIADGLRTRGIGVDVLSLDADAAWEGLQGGLLQPSSRPATLVYAEGLASSTASVLRVLNQKRDVLARLHPRPLLWVTTPALDRLLWDHAPDLWSVAAVPIRIETTMSWRLRTPEAILEQLFGELFNATELRRFVAHFAPELTPRLPGPTASFAALTGHLVQALERHGLIGARLFKALERAYPSRRARIREVAALWGTTSASEALPEASARGGPTSLASVLRGPAGALTITAIELTPAMDGSTFLEQIRAATAQDRGSWLMLAARASDEALARTPADWRERLREAVGPSLRHWLGASSWLIVAVVDPLAPERLCDPADFAAPEVFAEFFAELLERDLGEAALSRLSISLLVRFPGRIRRALARRLRSRMKLEFALLRADAPA